MTRRRVQRKSRPVFVWPAWLKCGCGWGSRILLAVLLVVVVSFGWRIARHWTQRTWLGVEPYRVLVLRQQSGDAQVTGMELVSIWPNTHKIEAMELPIEAVIGAVGGYGNYRMVALLEMGKVEGVGDTLLQNSLSWLMGIPVHQVYRQTNTTLSLAREGWNLRKRALLGQQSWPEAFAIAGLLSQVKGDEVQRLVLSEDNVVRQRMEADGSQIQYFETALLDRLMASELSTVWSEAADAQVAAINASGKPQLAAAWARYARLGGFDVVSVTDQQQLQEKTRIIFSNKQLESGMVGKALRLLYPLAKSEVGDTSQYRAEIAIVFGLDSWKWLNDRVMYLE